MKDEPVLNLIQEVAVNHHLFKFCPSTWKKKHWTLSGPLYQELTACLWLDQIWLRRQITEWNFGIPGRLKWQRGKFGLVSADHFETSLQYDNLQHEHRPEYKAALIYFLNAHITICGHYLFVHQLSVSVRSGWIVCSEKFQYRKTPYIKSCQMSGWC